MHFLRILLCLATVAATPALARDFDPEGRVVVKFRDGSVARMQPAATLRTLAPQAVPVARLPNAVEVLRTGSRGEADALIAQLAAHPDIEYAMRDPLLQRTVVDDPWYAGPINLDGRVYTLFQGDLYNPVGGVDAPAAWARGATGRGIVVAVLDTGITAHPDLDANVVPGAGYDFITDAFVSGRDTDARSPGGWDLGDWAHLPPYVEACPGGTSSWHGSHVTGTIAAIANNGYAMAGMAHEARILPMRVLGHCGGYTSDIAAAITWASGGVVEGVPVNETPAEVLNLSLGGRGACPAFLQEAIDGAVARGSTIVVAAGNSGMDVSGMNPANCRNVITVGSNGLTGKRAFYSNHGAGITLAAPGGGVYRQDAANGTPWIPGGYIWSTMDVGQTTPVAAGMGPMAGTSQAAPHVAAIVAMMQSVAPKPYPPATIAHLLAHTARMFPVGVDRPLGAGIADAGAAVQAAMLGHVPVPSATPLSTYAPTMHVHALQGQSRHFRVAVPAGTARLILRTYGGAGDVDLYVRHGEAASPDAHDHASIRPGNNSVVVIDAPQAGDHYLALHGTQAYSAVQVRATLE